MSQEITTKPRGKAGLHFLEIAYSLILCGWTVVPLFLPDFYRIHPLKLFWSFTYIMGSDFSFLQFLTYFLIAIPGIALLKLVAPFLKKKLGFIFQPDSFLAILLNIINSALAMGVVIVFILSEAAKLSYLLRIHYIVYAVLGLSIVFNIFQVLLLVKKLKRMSSSYQKYQAYLQKLDKKKKAFIISIQKKLLISFFFLFIIVIGILSYLTMRENKSTILASVIANGRTLAGTTAKIIEQAAGTESELTATMRPILENLKKTNSEMESLQFDAITVYYRALEQKEEAYRIKYSTYVDQEKVKEAGTYENALLESLPINETVTKEFLNKDFFTIENTEIKRIKGVYYFFSPFRVGKLKLGYVVINYKEEVVFESYFRNLVRIVIFSLFSLYLAIILIYIIGDNIVRPLLYLRMNVNQVGSTLSDMIQGKMKIAAAGLVFEDVVKTRDEIKDLSREMDNMVTVIRGIIPYISISTFKQSDKADTKPVIRELTFLFTDIRGFTTLCEGMQPAKVVNLLNHYLDLQTQIILNNGGDIDKFVGDEVFAVFEGEDKEIRASKASLELRSAMQEEKEKRQTLYQQTVAIGIGINTGKSVFGSVGARERMDFTCIGDNVNIAARLEGANKEYRSKTLLTEAVYKKISASYLCRQIDFMTVKGKEKPILIYELLQEKSKASKLVKELKAYYEKGLEAYQRQEWAEAMKNFKHNIDNYKDGPSEVLLERCKIYRQTPPPPDWDGVFRLSSK